MITNGNDLIQEFFLSFFLSCGALCASFIVLSNALEIGILIYSWGLFHPHPLPLHIIIYIIYDCFLLLLGFALVLSTGLASSLILSGRISFIGRPCMQLVNTEKPRTVHRFFFHFPLRKFDLLG